MFGFGNVWALARRLGVPAPIAPLVAPAVDLSVVAQLVALRHLAIRGASRQELIPARWLLVASCLTTLALNVAEPMINAEYGRARFDCVGPLLLIGWSHVGPDLLSAIHRSPEDRPTFSAEPDAGCTTMNTLPAVDRSPVPAAEVTIQAAKPFDGDPISAQLLAAATKVNADHWLECGRPASAETLRKRLHIWFGDSASAQGQTSHPFAINPARSGPGRVNLPPRLIDPQVTVWFVSWGFMSVGGLAL